MKIQVIGVHWNAYIEQGSLATIRTATAAMEYTAPDCLETRSDIADWLTYNAGDFSEVLDFASLPEIEFAAIESEDFYRECIGID